jgi:hypothetical protein
MIIKNHAQTIQALTEKMNAKEKFALVNFPRSALVSLNSNNSERKGNKYFAKAIRNSFEIQDKNYLKAVPASFIYSSDESNTIDYTSVLKDQYYYDSTCLETYFSSREDIFKSFANHYIKYSSFIIVSFHDKKMITKTLGDPVEVINVPYNDFYDKTDSIFEQIAKFDNKIDYCLFDCPLLSSALPYKIWNELNMSMIDLGKVFSFARSNYLNKMKERENEKATKSKFVRRG